MPRPRKPRHLDERFEWYAPFIEQSPAECAGTWIARRFPQAREVRLDLGCGKGSFVLKSAAAEPDVLFVGIDRERICVAMAAKAAMEAQIPNVVFAQAEAEDLGSIFAPGELACIYLNFCTPNPPAHDARRRLTHAQHLHAYRPLLASEGEVRFRTDSAPLFEYSVQEFAVAGYQVLWQTRDLHAEQYEVGQAAQQEEFRNMAKHPTPLPYYENTDGHVREPLGNAASQNPQLITSEYEDKLAEKGASICALVAVPGEHVPTLEEMEEAQASVNQSLATYLPEDLDSLTYIPYGMEDTVRNLKNRRAKLAARAAKAIS